MRNKNAASASSTNLSYDLMHLLRNSLHMNSYTLRDKNGNKKAVVTLSFTTSDGKIHQLANMEIDL